MIEKYRKGMTGEVLRSWAEDAQAELDALRTEKERLLAWLYKIEGGDTPCFDDAQLRRWAYEATTRRAEAP